MSSASVCIPGVPSGHSLPKGGMGDLHRSFWIHNQAPLASKEIAEGKGHGISSRCVLFGGFFLNIFAVDDLQEPQDPKMKNLDEIGACLDHHSRANPEMRQVVAGAAPRADLRQPRARSRETCPHWGSHLKW